ncbi:LytR/AlgR family response regulator transcription factor [Marinoscillum furvescens]|uniref:LytTR family two component transcriptional regulator n=1 Tax=Marinoscillum furvescens DSM 4134 TaxID=1122208 RepID=A0A3D9KW47_MARFU|nr:LytTR family DNA-binding domain-containing protein [Marinoscillum furvescens]RED92041.1 LytTR family two component transcriptional regulator [Marinoscillum furvescens DSM 4134]
MKYVILEDERLAADRLIKLVKEKAPELEHLITLDSVESAIKVLPSLTFDFLFLDIQLADGLSFEILDQVTITAPIIFTTAYDEYALRAFQANSIDYLLKPIVPDELERALNKLSVRPAQEEDIHQLLKTLKPQGKEQFVVKVGDRLKTVKTKDTALIYSYNKGTFVFAEGRSYPVDYTMDKVEELLDPQVFFRISRKFIIHVDHASDMLSFTNSRIIIKVPGFDLEQVVVARERVGFFKKWLDR